MNQEQIVHELTMEIMKKEIERAYQASQNLAPMPTDIIAEQVMEKYISVAKVMNNKINSMKQATKSSPLAEKNSEHPKLTPTGMKSGFNR